MLRRSSRPIVMALALAFCCRLLIAQAAHTKSLFEQGNAAKRRNDPSEAVLNFRAYLQGEPKSPEGYFNLGLALEMGGHLDEALSALQKAASLQPNLHGLRLFTCIVNYKLNHLSAAHDELMRETRVEPKNAASWMWLGAVELAQNEAVAAASDLDKAAALDPKNLDILYHRGRARLLVSKESYAAMFKLAPDSWRVHEVLAQADAEAFRADDAISEFRLAIAGAPLEPGLHEELGDACWTAGKLQEADDAYAEEIKIDTTNAVALYKLGSLRVIRDDAASGVPLLEQVLTLEPALSDAHYYWGNGDGELGKDDVAIEEFRLATNPQGSEELNDNLGLEDV